MRERLKQNLRQGYTTGACAAAAAKGAAIMLARQELIKETTIDLPAGYPATFQLQGCSYSSDRASCFTVKDAGDDPDITNGAEVHAEVTATCYNSVLKTGNVRNMYITITGGVGIGRVTKPGLAVPPGEYAINPVPRQMIENSLRQAFLHTGDSSSLATCDCSLHVTISIPNGELLSKKTLNSRLGIIGGLSILGTTGIVRPISSKAWTDTIDAALDVAKASGCSTVILSTGRTSELAAQKRFSASLTSNSQNVPAEEAYIMMGDHVAYALRAAAERNFTRPIIACQFAKLLKIACGHVNTHASASELDLTKLLSWAKSAVLPSRIIKVIENANTAREVAIACDFAVDLVDLVKQHAIQASKQHEPRIEPVFIVADYKGELQEVLKVEG